MACLSSVRAVSLRRLLPDATLLGSADIEVHSVSADSRTVQAGEIFVAIRGTRSDGHQFVEEAVRRGASGLLVERPCPAGSLPQCVVPDTRVAHAMLCQALEGIPAARLKVVGITGTNGKTTTSVLVKSVLEAAGHRVGLVGTIEQFDGNTTFPAALTTPGPAVLARLMHRMVDARCSHVVMEVSSHALEQRRVAGISFDVAIFTNLSQDHLDYHRDLASYAQAKGRLFRELRPSATAILNADDPTSQTYQASCPAQVVRYGLQGAADFMAEGIRLSLDGSRFSIASCGSRHEIQTPLLGEHNVYNCLAAAAVGRQLGLDWSTIQVGIEQVLEIPGRLQAVRCGQPFHVLVDYAHTPDALRSVLKSLRAIAAGRVLCLFGAGGDRDRTKRPAMAQAAAADADLVVVTSDNPRSENPQQIISDIVAGFGRAYAVAIEPDRRAAIELVLSVARPGDCVLIAGKGHESYQIVGGQRLPFDDRLVAAECLAKYGGEHEPTQRIGTEQRHTNSPLGLLACGA